MSESSTDIPLVPLVASLLRRLEYSPSSPPFYGRLALFDEAWRPDFAKPLHHRALWHALPDQPRLAGRRTMETEVAGWSSDGDVEFRARVLPGCGFCKNGGLPASPDVSTAFTDFSLSGSLVVFLLGFNDSREEHWQVEESMRHHADSYRNAGCKVAFIEANDHHNSCYKWITDIAWKLAQEDPENIIFLPTTTWDPNVIQVEAQDASELKFPFPARGWASDSSDDYWHLSQSGLLEWLPVVKDVMERLARREDCSKVLLVTDSTFQAHDYIQYDCVIVRTKGGATTTFGISKSSTVRNLKTFIVQSGFPRRGIRLEQINLAVSEDEVENGAFLQDDQALADCGVKDGVMLHLVVDDGLDDPEPGVPGTSPLAFYLPRSFCCDPQTLGPGLYRMQLTGVEENLSWSAGDGNCTCYFGAGYRNGKTISEEGVERRGGIYGSSDKDVALLYSCPYEHKTPQGVRLFKAVLEGRVQAGKSRKCERLDHQHVPNKHDIEVVALIILVQCDPSIMSIGPALPPAPEHGDADPDRAVEVTPEVEHDSSQPASADAAVAPEEERSPTAPTNHLNLQDEPMSSLMNRIQVQFRTTPKCEAERHPDDEQQFRVTVSVPGKPCVRGEWARGKQDAKRVALIKFLSETPLAPEDQPWQMSNIAQLNERFQKKFLTCPDWVEPSCSIDGKFRAAIRIASSVIEGPDCDSKQEAKIAALWKALEAKG